MFVGNRQTSGQRMEMVMFEDTTEYCVSGVSAPIARPQQQQPRVATGRESPNVGEI